MMTVAPLTQTLLSLAGQEITQCTLGGYFMVCHIKRSIGLSMCSSCPLNRSLRLRSSGTDSRVRCCSICMPSSQNRTRKSCVSAVHISVSRHSTGISPAPMSAVSSRSSLVPWCSSGSHSTYQGLTPATYPATTAHPCPIGSPSPF